jgi:hypothetical protein
MASTIPITRSTPAARLANFNANSTSLYNKYSPYTSYSIGPSQPFIYTKISDSNISRNLTKYDTQALPIGSTARDLKRIGQYMITGNGLLYTGKQLLLQKSNAFNETRIYNPLSLLKATAKPGSTGLIDYPQRHLETSGGILNFFKDALLSTIGYSTKDADKPRIDGTATGVGGVAYSAYAGARGGARAGLLRFGTANKASSIFNETWVSNASTKNSGGFLAKLGSALLSKLKSFIPSTNPLGAFGGSAGETWKYRPEYQTGKDGIYYSFLSDNSGFFKVNTRGSVLFYNDRKIASATGVEIASNFHKYYPKKQDDESSAVLYAKANAISTDTIGAPQDADGYQNNLKDLYKRMVKSIDSYKNETGQFKKSAERYSEVKDDKGVSYPVYENLPDGKDAKDNFSVGMGKKFKGLTLDGRGFSKAPNAGGIIGTEDLYNALDPLPNGVRNNPPRVLRGAINEFGKGVGQFGAADDKQSADVIFFYFFDLINNVYIPFRATISALSDQHSAEWEDINYLGRADKLFLYKGFSRDVNFSFTVYANSAKEMLPMWNRINYLVGLTKPSKYTGKAEITNEEEIGETTGRESRFIYPPMVTLRLGDLFNDQPCVISSIGINVPDDANWESLRTNEYSYDSSPLKNIKYDSNVKSRQLPMRVDVSVALKLMEKRQALGSDGHYGKSSYDSSGKETRWSLL